MTDASARFSKPKMQLLQSGGDRRQPQNGFRVFEDALIDSIDMATAALFQRKGQLSGISTGSERAGSAYWAVCTNPIW